MRKMVFVLLPLFAFIFLACDSTEQTDVETEAEMRAKIEQELRLEEKSREQEIQMNIDDCQRGIWELYHKSWIEYCENNNIPITVDEDGLKTCSIDRETAERYDSMLQEEKERCVTRYK